jgi:glucokinase
MKNCILGVDIGKTNVRVAVSEGAADLKYYRKHSYRSASPKEFEEQLVAAIGRALDECGRSRDSVSAIGIDVPAIVNRDDGTIFYGPDFDYMGNYSITHRLGEIFGVPVVAEVDTVMAAWGELWAGAGRTCKNFALITWGTGLGAGLIVDGEVVEGRNHLFPEFGHSVVSDDDWPCNCGSRGCLNALVTGPGIARHGALALESGATTILRDLAGDDSAQVTSPMVFEAAERGDKAALSILERVGVLLGRLCANLVYALQPEKIVIVGGLAERAHWILETMARTMHERCWLLFRGFTKCEIASSILGDTAGVLGAIRKAQLMLTEEEIS